MLRPRFSGRTLARGLCLGLAAIGIGCFSWAVIGIAQPIDFLVGYPGSPYVASSVSTARTVASLAALAHPKVGNKVGVLSIPALGQKLPIVEGTTASQLKRGVGHFHGSTMPGGEDNCILSGHRDTVFTKLGKLKKGNRLVVTTAAGTFTYKITQIRIVSASDKTVVVHKDHAALTVTTCYPFHYIGSAPKRYVLVARLVAPK